MLPDLSLRAAGSSSVPLRYCTLILWFEMSPSYFKTQYVTRDVCAGHACLCQACFDGLMQTPGQRQCPMCRATVDGSHCPADLPLLHAPSLTDSASARRAFCWTSDHARADLCAGAQRDEDQSRKHSQKAAGGARSRARRVSLCCGYSFPPSYASSAVCPIEGRSLDGTVLRILGRDLLLCSHRRVDFLACVACALDDNGAEAGQQRMDPHTVHHRGAKVRGHVRRLRLRQSQISLFI